MMEELCDSNTKIIKVSPDGAVDSVLYSSLFENIEYIPLETTDSSLIGNIDKLIVAENSLVIVDKSITKAIYCVDKKGKFKFKISELGIGPDEYVDINDVDFDEAKQEFLIYSTATNKIVFYGTNGQFLCARKVPHKGLALAKTNVGSFVLYSSYLPQANKDDGETPNILICDDEKVIEESFLFDNRITTSVTWTSFPWFSRFNDTLAIKPDHNNIVFHICKNEIKPAYMFDFGKYNINSDYWEVATSKGMTSKRMNEYVNESGVCESVRFLESCDYVYVEYYHRNRTYHILYSKKTGKVLNFRKAINDINYLSSFNPIAIENDKLYGLISPSILARISSDKIRKLLFGSEIGEVEFSDNPILIVFKLKQF
ncbi:MAG: 6-bladed beta-propeller [Bacteroidaceae bacterium]|nr:6-bladed beta-propeller [Bacteroidaceae bacterium]